MSSGQVVLGFGLSGLESFPALETAQCPGAPVSLPTISTKISFLTCSLNLSCCSGAWWEGISRAEPGSTLSNSPAGSGWLLLDLQLRPAPAPAPLLPVNKPCFLLNSTQAKCSDPPTRTGDLCWTCSSLSQTFPCWNGPQLDAGAGGNCFPWGTGYAWGDTAQDDPGLLRKQDACPASRPACCLPLSPDSWTSRVQMTPCFDVFCKLYTLLPAPGNW